jgi:hypothetical protein
MGNPPFIAPRFASGPPTAQTNVWEDGPGPFLNPPNTGQVVRYNGQDQVTRINTAAAMPAWELGCGACDPAISAVNTQAPSGTGYVPKASGEVGTINAGANIPVTTAGTPAQIRFFIGADGNLYAVGNQTTQTYLITGPVASPPQLIGIYSPTK